MLYLRLRGIKKRLYINVEAIGQALLVVGWLVAYLYLSNQDYLAKTGQYLINLK
mgnify:CR=1 FL=1